MVKINRTVLPPEIIIETENDYRSVPVYNLLKKDFHGKCYICEDDQPTGIQIEHRHSHKSDAQLKYDWRNLFYSCYHCNHAKLGHYDSIIDCTQIDPEDYVMLELASELKTTIKVIKIGDTSGIDETIALLNRVYNGDTTAILSDECANLRKSVETEIRNFQDKLYEYIDEPDMEIKTACAKSLCSLFSRESAFAAFKRSIVKNNVALLAEFGASL